MADPALAEQVALLEQQGSRVLVITPDEAATAAFGADPLSPAVRTPAGHAGLAQGRAAAAAVQELWA